MTGGDLRATYRLQLNSQFTLDDAAAVLPYLAALGVSHAYLSPITTARPGSTHGYDVVDHNRINPELGGEAAWDRFSSAARSAGLGVLADIVPNHVGIGGASNAWWLDVLEWGPDSRYATHFDIQWYSERAGLAGQILVPMLGRQYGEALEAGDLALRFDAQHGSLSIWAPGDHRLPLRPADYGTVLSAALPALRELFRAQRDGGPGAVEQADLLKRELATLGRAPAMRARIDDRIARLNGRAGDSASFDALDRLLQRQHWRIASHRVAADDINYRRFFNINDLAGVRVEDPALFAELHAMVLRRVAAGEIHGLRVDHIDGLYDPERYCERLRAATPDGCYLVVEKILAAHERLPPWPVQGTTGYDFAATATALFVDDSAAEQFTRIYRDFTGCSGDFDALLAECKHLVMRRELASELAVLARMATRLAQSQRRSRDFTRAALTEALREIVACFPVYRSYVTERGVSDDDRRHIGWAVGRARRRLRELDDSVFDVLHELLLGRLDDRSDIGALEFAMKLQQYTGPVMAKGMEDTAFYRFNRLLALNEVGAQPAVFGIGIAAFHQQMQQRARERPQDLLAGSTHDTKRGEDARARVAALTAFPQEWEQVVRSSSRLLRARRGVVADDTPPFANDEYALFQSLLGSWPESCLGERPLADCADWADLKPRLQAAALKSLREGKSHTSWSRPDEAYEAAVAAWIDVALDASRPNAFLDAFRAFAARVAATAREFALVQTLLRFTVPGVPDLYQGSERGELSLVDPDNRRPVDFDACRRQLTERSNAKQHLIATLLALRRAQPRLFRNGAYAPANVRGPLQDALLAFERRDGDVRLLIVAFVRQVSADARDNLDECTLEVPSAAAAWRDLFDQRPLPGDPVLSELLRGASYRVLVSGA